ncbi:OmpW family protein [Halioglobus sp. HI00S01]|uniref:OmpW/AlkL family protein n=1 Tax=Halioglobus sp. HI00S01 TaxID=1822214 RepID=UPI000AF2E1E5|nr:OmpW family outer membrane protein [Halioglobus sp. HI00S01]
MALAGSTAVVQAYEAGDWILRAGAVTVAPDADSDIVDETLPVTVDVDDNTQLSIIGASMVDPNWGIELLVATPFSHDIDVNEVNAQAGETKHLPPTLSVQWYPRGAASGWQPYVGIGINYTHFFDEKADSDLEGIVGNADLDLDDSFGLSASAGVDMPLGEHWALNAGVWYIDIDTTATVTLKDAGDSKVRFDVDIDPWVYNVGIAYKF